MDIPNKNAASSFRLPPTQEDTSKIRLIKPLPNDQKSVYFDFSELPQTLCSRFRGMVPFPIDSQMYEEHAELFMSVCVPPLMSSLMAVPHPIYASGMMLLLHAKPPKNGCNPLQDPEYLKEQSYPRVINSFEWYKVLRCMLYYWGLLDKNQFDEAHRESISEAMKLHDVRIKQYIKRYRDQLKDEPAFTAMRIAMRAHSYATPAPHRRELFLRGNPNPNGTLSDADVDPLQISIADRFANIEFEYLIYQIRVMELTMAQLLDLDLKDAQQHLLTPLENPKKEHMANELCDMIQQDQMLLAKMLIKKTPVSQFFLPFLDLKAIEQTSKTFKGILSHYFLYQMLEGLLLPCDHPYLSYVRQPELTNAPSEETTSKEAETSRTFEINLKNFKAETVATSDDSDNKNKETESSPSSPRRNIDAVVSEASRPLTAEVASISASVNKNE